VTPVGVEPKTQRLRVAISAPKTIRTRSKHKKIEINFLLFLCKYKVIAYFDSMKTFTIFFIGFFFCTINAAAQSWNWGKENTKPPNGQGAPLGSHSVAADAFGNVYGIGVYNGTLLFGTDTVLSYHGVGSYLIKYDKNGNLKWVRGVQRIPFPNIVSEGVSTDGASDVYETGYFFNTAVFGTDTFQSNGGIWQMYLVKYDMNGNVLWAKESSRVTTTSNYCLGLDVASDISGNAYVTGWFDSTVFFGTDTLKYTGEGEQQVYIVKYDPNGNALWATQSTGTGGEPSSSSIALDHSGNVYITGYFEDTVNFGTNILYPTLGTTNAFIAKYDKNGNPLWARQSANNTTNSSASGFSISVDALSNAYITGDFTSSVTFGADTVKNLTEDVFFTKYDSSGDLRWAKQGIPLSTCNWYGYSLASDTLPSGGGFIIMQGQGTPPISLKYGVDTFNLNTGSHSATVLFQFDSSGNVVCSSVIGEGGKDVDDGVGVDHSGRYIYISGELYDTTVFGNDTLVYGGEAPFVARWNPCCNISIHVSPLDTTICAGDSVTLVATGGGTYKWSNSSTASSILIVPSSTTSYSVGVSNGFCAKDTSTTITVNPLPVVSITPDTSICAGKGITLTITGGGTYLWSNASTSSSISLTPSSTITYTVVVTDNGCSKDAAVTVIVDSVPLVTITSPQKICPGTAVTLLATGGGKYLWSTGATTDSISVSPTSTTTYSVTVSIVCKATSSTIVTVENLQIYACCDTTISSGNSVSLNASGSDIIHYQWTPSTRISCDTCPVVTVSPTVTTTYTVVGTDSLGCQTERIVVIIVDIPCVGFTIPNVFTPDFAGQQGLNQVFYIKAENMSAWSIIIYDRWGKEMFKSGNPIQYWDGTTEGGSKAPDGVYYYIISATCQNNTYKKDGFVQLIR
jgi:gliding motility-associated-like protein